jgi:hydrogenase maturation protease
MSEKTLVLALGNILRADDGVGAVVVSLLEDYPAVPDVDLLDGGTPGFETVLLMQDYAHVIVIDAADMELAPGEWRQFSPDEVRLKSRDLHLRGTLHYAGLAEALSLGAALDLLPPHITIIGVQPASIEWEMGLTDAVQAATRPVAEYVYSVLTAESELTS